MPTLYRTLEHIARIENRIVVVLIMNGTSNTVPKHSLRKRRQRLDRILLQKRSSRGITRRPELIEFILGYHTSAQRAQQQFTAS